MIYIYNTQEIILANGEIDKDTKTCILQKRAMLAPTHHVHGSAIIKVGFGGMAARSHRLGGLHRYPFRCRRAFHDGWPRVAIRMTIQWLNGCMKLHEVAWRWLQKWAKAISDFCLLSHLSIHAQEVVFWRILWGYYEDIVMRCLSPLQSMCGLRGNTVGGPWPDCSWDPQELFQLAMLSWGLVTALGARPQSCCPSLASSFSASSLLLA